MPDRPAPQISAHGAVDAYSRLEDWLRQRRKYTLITIVAIALVLRVFCFLELANSPCFWWHEWRESDLNTFHSWALTIAEGDWWSTTVRPPLHGWHREIAADYARLFPEQWAALEAANPTDDPDAAARALWNRWCGGGRTYQGPLYPYLVAGTYMLLGAAVGWVYAWQAVLGAVSVVLVHLIARRYFGDVAAVLAAGLTLLYGPLLFYEFTLLRATLVAFFGLLLVVLLDRARDQETTLAWLGVGLLLGLALALKAHFLLMVFAAAGLVVARWRKRPRRLAVCAAVLLTGLTVSFSPVVVRNHVAEAPALSTASNAAPTFLISNAENSDCTSWKMGYAAQVLGESNGVFLPTVIATLKTHPTISSYLRLLANKLLATWYWYESPNNANFYYAQLHSDVLRLLPVSFGLIAPLSLVGMVLALARPGRCAPLFFLVLSNLAVLYVFFVFSRFRVPLAAALLPFAGFGAARLVQFILTRRWKATCATLVAGGLPALYTLSPAVGHETLTRPADVQVAYMVYYDIQVRSALASGDLDGGAEVLRESLRHQPREVRALGPGRPARSVEEARLAGLYARIYQSHASILQEAGRSTEARTQLRRAAELHQAAESVLAPAQQ